MKNKLKILFVVNVDWFFISHRLPIALEGIKRGFDIYLATSDTGRRREIESHGIQFIEVKFERSSKNPLNELGIIFCLKNLYRKFNFDIIHHVTIKPSIYGSIAARLCGTTPTVVNAISGLGYNFTADRKSVFQKLLFSLMKFGFNYSKVNFIFQNPDDLGFYSRLGYLTQSNFTLIKGAGVDQNEFPLTPPVEKERLIVLLPGRMLFDKGIAEFCKAAKTLKRKWYGKAEFVLCGDIDRHNPAGATELQVKEFLMPGYINWIGHQKNIIDVLVNADIVCLPSYREGLPKALIEAMAIGRPIITTDAPGCRECVEEKFNGYLVPIKDYQLLAEKIDVLLSNERLRLTMGTNSRIKMLNELALSTVIQSTYCFYEKIYKQ